MIMKDSLVGFAKSFKHAFHGVGFVLKGRTFRVQSVTAILVIAMGFYFSLSQTEWLAIVIVIFTVLVVEALNTSVEEVCNIVKDLPGVQPGITKRSRDIAAGSSLIMSICSLIVGLIVFLPKIINLFR